MARRELTKPSPVSYQRSASGGAVHGHNPARSFVYGKDNHFKVAALKDNKGELARVVVEMTRIVGGSVSTTWVFGESSGPPPVEDVLSAVSVNVIVSPTGRLRFVPSLRTARSVA